MLKQRYRPVILCILDGWGLSPGWGGNAISAASPKNFNRLWRVFPHAVLQAGGYLEPYQNEVNSEIMHTTLGAGQLILSAQAIISQSIKTGSFFQNKVFLEAINFARQKKSALHLIQLISPAQNIAKTEHLIQFLKFVASQGLKNVFIHAILDGQDAPANLGLVYLEYLDRVIAKLGIGKIATICGRHFALSSSWPDVFAAYSAMAENIGQKTSSYVKFLKNCYARGIGDSNVPPTVIAKSSTPQQICDRDVAVFLNFDAGTTGNLVRAFADPRLAAQPSPKGRKLKNLYLVTLTDYNLDLPVKVAFVRPKIRTSLPQILAHYRLHQLKAGEEIKKPHITYYFSGQVNRHYPGEDWLIVPTLNASEWIGRPQLSLKELIDELIPHIGNYDFILLNIANLDLIAHTGDILAVKEAVRFVDEQLGRLANVIYKLGGCLILTSDHGNAEQVVELHRNRQKFRNTFNPVPFILIASGYEKRALTKTALAGWKSTFGEILVSKHTLADVAPTILELLELPRSPEMTGTSLIDTLK